jgi:broad specificity phosphatase PhoE
MVPDSPGGAHAGEAGAALRPRPARPSTLLTMTVGRMFLLRHGETEWSLSGRHTGRTDVPLTERGRELAAAAGRLVPGLHGTPPALVLTSPRSRARDTAQLAGFRVDDVDERLAEWDYGEYEGRTTGEIRATVPGWTVWTHPCPGGETSEEVARRADSVIAHTADALGRGDVVLVGHGHFSRVLVARWIGLPAAEGVRFAMEAPSWAVLGHERGVPRLDHVNLTPKGRS